MKAPRIEPGLLTIFRLFPLVQLVLMVVNLHVHLMREFLITDPLFGYAFVGIGTLLLLSYLSMHWLEERLDRFYLPIALLYSTVFSLLAHYLFLTEHSGGGSEESAWQLFLFLSVPLILVSWQYGFRVVLAFCLFVTLLDAILARWMMADFAQFEQTYHRLSFIRFMSFLIAGYVISRVMQELRSQRQALQEANLRLGNYISTLEQLTISRERNRVARELHDTLAHTLSGLAIQLEAAHSLWNSDSDQAHRLVQQSLQVTRDGLTETRNAIQSLRATPLQDLGLANAIREYADTTVGRGGLRLVFDIHQNIEGLPPDVEQCFFRIAQEAIENVSRHARATILKVKLLRVASTVCMEICDNGVGFDSQTQGNGRHFGLQGMRERAELIHAHLELTSQAGAGTSLTLSWQDRGNK